MNTVPGSSARQREQVELLRGQRDLDVVDAHPPRAPVDLQRPVPLRAAGVAGGRAPAGDGADARQQLAEAERLHQVVVGPELEADDTVDLLARGR